MTVETWKPISGWESFYEVSDLGRIRSVARTVSVTGQADRKIRTRILKTPPTKAGYPCCNLAREGRIHTVLVHQIVAATFIGPRPDGEEVRHLDGIPAHVTLDNLAYGTPTQNREDSLRHGTHWPASKTHCKAGHEFDGTRARNGKTSRTCSACARTRSERFQARPSAA